MTRRAPKDGHGTRRIALSPDAVNGSTTTVPSTCGTTLPAAPAPLIQEPGAVPHRSVHIAQSPYLIEGWLYLPGRGAIRAAYAVLDQWGWAVMARRGKHIVTIRRVDYARYPGAAARSLACVEVEHQTDNWRAPTPAPVT